MELDAIVLRFFLHTVWTIFKVKCSALGFPVFEITIIEVFLQSVSKSCYLIQSSFFNVLFLSVGWKEENTSVKVFMDL